MYVAWDQALLGLHELPNLHACVFFSRIDSQLSSDCEEFDPNFETLTYIPGIEIMLKEEMTGQRAY